MKTYIQKISVFIIVLLTCVGCGEIMDPWSDPKWTGKPSSMWFVNNTEEDIVVLGMHDIERPLTPSNFFIKEEIATHLAPHESYKIEYYPRLLNKFSTSFEFIIYKQSTLDKYTKEEIIEKDIYDKLMVLKYNDLEQLNFCVTYDGDWRE